ncbi:MAG: hypothetical protein SFY92_10940 [Verrucomicrobiae bacterium]|nr:hypothetical protein [Verrucomicrobiae bacterium]
MRRPVSVPLLLLGVLAAFCPLRAELQLGFSGVQPGAGIDVKIVSSYDTSPRVGTLPLRVTIGNNTGTARTWNLSTLYTSHHFGSDSISSTESLTVGGHSEKTFEIHAPILARENIVHSGGNLMISLSGYGIKSGGNFTHMHDRGSPGGKQPSAYTLMGAELALKSWAQIDADLAKGPHYLQGSKITPEFLPRDWRSLMGVDMMMLSEAEWTGTPEPQRQAVLEWILQGGELRLYAASPESFNDKFFTGLRRSQWGVSNGLPKFRMVQKMGAGRVLVHPWDGSSPVEFENRTHGLASNTLATGYRGVWPLLMKIPSIEVIGYLIMAFMLVFAIIIGPINLFIFAGSHHRSRLFWTTPLISLITSVLLVVVIFFKDGMGGEGRRSVVAILDPDLNKMFLSQEQSSVTGLLWDRDIPFRESVFMAPLPQNASGRPSRETYEIRHNLYSGSWFASRSVNNQYLSLFQPTRFRLELVNRTAFEEGREAPRITSTIPTPLAWVVFTDGVGQTWEAQNVPTGGTVTLKKIPPDQKQSTLTSLLRTHLGPRNSTLAEQAAFQPGFVAQPADAAAFTTATLPSIRWEKDFTLLVQPMPGLAPTPPPPVTNSSLRSDLPVYQPPPDSSLQRYLEGTNTFLISKGLSPVTVKINLTTNATGGMLTNFVIEPLRASPTNALPSAFLSNSPLPALPAPPALTNSFPSNSTRRVIRRLPSPKPSPARETIHEPSRSP